MAFFSARALALGESRRWFHMAGLDVGVGVGVLAGSSCKRE
jgi:hypothetical protein